MRTILATAFEVQLDQIIGPNWLQDNALSFDIIAKLPPGTTKEQANIMMQNLLQERFHLDFHRDKKEFPVYELVIAKGGSKLKDAAPDDIYWTKRA